ncbi:MAG: 16S rRNA (cytosine(1402)-N(4))-methyltransferase RsmH [Candidatus Paceibacterota bacterium]|jgi:16S rRNA (cytosine1402-N4)-methyltransferase
MTVHKTVLLHEAIENLDLKPGSIYFDGTLGGAGHVLKVCSDLKDKVRVIAVDRDIDAIKRAEEKLSKISCKHDLILSDYRNMDKVLVGLKIKKVDAILLDLGLSSDQLDVSGRGFSFRNNEPLLMTFANEENPKVTAEIILNNWKEETIADILYGYSDERYSRRIAKAIIQARKKKEIKTTNDLLEIIQGAVPLGYQKGRTHFATKTFQALRIAVNDEITALKEGMEKGWRLLNKGGRMAIISFHSVEDREVKNFFRDKAKMKEGRLINKKPITPKEEEIHENPRSRSAKLRVIEKII